MAHSFGVQEASDLPGFYKDPTTGHYFAIPTNPSTCIPAIFTEVSAQIAREESSFNKIPIQIRTDRRFHKQNMRNGLPGILNTHQTYSINAGHFATQLMKLKLRQLEKSNQTLDSEGFQVMMGVCGKSSCKFVICSDSLDVVSLCRNDKTLIYTIKKRFKNRTDDSFPPHILHHFTQKHLIDYKGTLAHMCPAKLDSQNYLLICVNPTYERKSKYELFPTNKDYSLPFFQFRCPFIMRCCAWNNKQKMIVIGTEKDILRKKLEDSVDHFLKFPQNNYKAVEISNDGDVLYTASPSGTLISYDFRTHNTLKIHRVGRGIDYMKILNNQYTLITSGYDDKLSNIDLRMGRVVFRYPGFNNKHRKILFTYNETWNVLCSTGQDDVTRYWNLQSGEALASLNPPMKSFSQLRSVLSVYENVLTTTVYVDDRIFCYQPL